MGSGGGGNFFSNALESGKKGLTDLSHGNLGGAAGNFINAQFGYNDTGDKQPDAPGINQDLTNLKNQQIQQAKDFRNNLAQTKQTLGQNLRQTSSNKLDQDLSNVNKASNQRGLLYSGINAGNQAAVRSQAQSGLAQGLLNLNTGLDEAANNMDINALNTGVAIQQQQQAIQNDIYSRAQAKLNSDNQQLGSIASTAGLAYLLA